MKRFAMYFVVPGIGQRQHVVRTSTQELAEARVRKAYPGRTVVITRVETSS